MRGVLQGFALAASAAVLAGCGLFQSSQPRQAQVTLSVADAAMAAGAPAMALRVAEIVLQRQPNDVAALMAKADALYALGATDDASIAYRQAVALDPSNSGAQIGLGRTLIRSDPHAAEAAFLAALTRQPDNERALNNLGIARDMQGHHEDAQKAYRQALTISPDSTDVQTNLGLSLALSGDRAAAVRTLQPIAAMPEALPIQRADLAMAMAQPGSSPQTSTIASGARVEQSSSFVPAAPVERTASFEPAVPTSATAQAALATPPSRIPPPASQAAAAPNDGAPIMITAAQVVAVKRENLAAKPPEPVAPRIIATLPPETQPAPTPPVGPASVVADASSVAEPPPSQAIMDLQAVMPEAETPPPASAPTAAVQPMPPQLPQAEQEKQQPQPPQPVLPSARLTAVQPQTEPAASLAPPHPNTGPVAGYYVQIAALDSERSALGEWRRMRARWPDLLADRAPTVQQADVNQRTFWRLRTGAFADAGSANDFCLKLRAAGSGCWTAAAARD
jgi:Flp pilus assembly protein TadD